MNSEKQLRVAKDNALEVVVQYENENKQLLQTEPVRVAHITDSGVAFLLRRRAKSDPIVVDCESVTLVWPILEAE